MTRRPPPRSGRRGAASPPPPGSIGTRIVGLAVVCLALLQAGSGPAAGSSTEKAAADPRPGERLATNETRVSEPAPPRSIEWRPAPLPGGDVRSLAFAPDDPSVAVAGTSAGQVFVSGDAGASWDHAGRLFPLPGWVVARLGFDGGEPHRLWAGLRGIWGGASVVVSQDRGRRWEIALYRPDDTLYDLEVSPDDPNRVLLGMRSGVWETEDGGESWIRLSEGDRRIREVSSVSVDPTDPDTIVAGTFRRAYRTRDGGETWEPVFEGMALDSQIFSLHRVPGTPDELWASTCGWVYKSLDGGGNWTRFREGLGERRTPSLQILPGGRLLAGTVSGIYASGSGGRHWSRLTRDDISIADLAIHPDRPEVILAGAEGSGIWRSSDGGRTFSPANRGIVAPRVVAVDSNRERLVAAVAHGGPLSGIYSGPDGESLRHETSTLPTVLAIAALDDGIWAATEEGLYRRSRVWEPVDGLASGRFENVVAFRGRALAHTDHELWSLGEHGASRLPVPIDRIRAMASNGSSLYVAGLGGLFEGREDRFRPVPVPAAGGSLAATGEVLVVAGEDGVWARSAGGRWTRLGEGRSRVIPLRGAGFVALAVAGDRLLALTTALEAVPVPVPFPARDVLDAAVHGDRLYLATSGTGLLSAPLPLTGPPSTGASAVASNP